MRKPRKDQVLLREKKLQVEKYLSEVYQLDVKLYKCVHSLNFEFRSPVIDYKVPPQQTFMFESTKIQFAVWFSEPETTTILVYYWFVINAKTKHEGTVKLNYRHANELSKKD